MSETSSIVSALGAGSGVDMVALANNLALTQFKLRNDRLAAKKDLLSQQISSASSIKNMLTQLASAMGERVRVGDLSPQPSVANGSVATASSPSGTQGSGTYSLEVLALASSQTLSSPALASSTTVVGAGKLTLRFGATTAAGFTEGTKAAVEIDIPTGATLSTIASAINAKSSGVTAYVAQTSSGAQLVLKGPDGAQNGFIVEATETAGQEGLAALAWNPSAGGASSRLLATASDASFKLDGLSMTSASNTISNVAPGLSLSLTGTNAGSPTKITFSNPSSTIATAMQDLVDALNEIAGDLKAATDPTSGDLAGDPGARRLKQQLSKLAGEIVMPNGAEGSRTLSDLGLAIQRDGTFKLDTTRLQATLTRDPAGVAAMFTTGLYGVYSTIDKVARAATTSTDPGSLGGSITRYQKLSTQITEQSAKLADQQETLRANLVSRFAKADTRISTSQSTLSFLKQQIESWNAGKD
ncbi:flagellar filament capping protein FliD [Croceibacterium sp. LX-88]|uniref:Flagellar hook-associated protein 2 n=1 Tax=Croceibacterium selenioxidans TaxID=2838833 RepID=A0ABS5W452_9SPHN|nr:flagellar filament capping protein FliD [Croceibacterium selenioxidans]MBT2133179.1 flagellar filament capping protein FliD [Croceibacterium selenioxidans]